MSTTVKALNIYIGDTKVFPDVDLSLVGDSFYLNPVIEDIKNDSTSFLTEHKCDVCDSFSGKTLICQDIDDTDNSAFHTNSEFIQNYWNFNKTSTDKANVLSIDFDINPKWLYNSIQPLWSPGTFQNYTGSSINFISTLKMKTIDGYNTNDHTQKYFSYNNLVRMFDGCNKLESITGLDLTADQYIMSGTLDTSNNNNRSFYVPELNEDHGYDYYTLETCNSTFNGCSSLTTLGITWPSTIYTNSTSYMFNGCHSLPENQIPTLNLHPIYIPISDSFDWFECFGGQTINIDNMFKDTNVSSLHISNDSWQYIRNASNAWQNTQVHEIDIPATATNLISINHIIGTPYYTESEGQRDFSQCRYIIRTTAPMTARLNNVDGADCLIYNFWDYDGDFNGSIYVPDSQLQDWKDYIGIDGDSPNTAANHVHPISDL